MWSVLATAQKGNASAFAFDQGFAIRGDIIKKHKMTQDQIIAAIDQARNWASTRSQFRYARGAQELISKANAGDAEIQYKLAQRYMAGERVIQDAGNAAKWFGKAAEQGHALAQTSLGALYLSGFGVPKDESKAVNWYRKSAAQGNEFGQANMGIVYRDGKGVPPDSVRAHMWLNLAASHDHVRDPKNEQRPLYLRDKLALSLSADETRQAHQLAVTWMRKNAPDGFRRALAKHAASAETGDADAQVEIGKLFYDGEGVPQSYAEALRWFRKAAGNDAAGAKFWLGVMHENGHGVSRDESAAFEWYWKAANQESGDAKAQFSLATYYRYGRAVTKDPLIAAKWYMKAANQGLRMAQLALSDLFAAGEGVEQDNVSAYKWCSIVMARGAPTQIYKLAKSTCTALYSRLTALDRKRAEALTKDWLTSNPSRKLDPYWLRLMGNDTIKLDPKTTIIVR